METISVDRDEFEYVLTELGALFSGDYGDVPVEEEIPAPEKWAIEILNGR